MTTSVNLNEAKLNITTHVLDISRGLPAGGLAVCLYKFENDKWILLKERYISMCIIPFALYIYIFWCILSRDFFLGDFLSL